MFDSISVDALPSGPGFCYAGYVNGEWADHDAIKARFPQANILSVAVTAGADADCLDVETGDATPAEAAAWYARQKARGIARPCLYADADTMHGDLVPIIQAAGISRAALRLWSAHYTGSPHICGPSSCGAVSIGMDGTQFTDSALGRELDQSLLLGDFFGSAPSPQPPPPVPAWEVTMMSALPTLAEGSDDTSLPRQFVRRVQVLANGIYKVSPPLAEDGVFGPATKAGIEKVQQQTGIAVDGTVAAQTWSVLVTGSAP